MAPERPSSVGPAAVGEDGSSLRFSAKAPITRCGEHRGCDA